MTSSFPGHSGPSASFEVPLEMLTACHHRIESQCTTLQRLVAHLATHDVDMDASIAAAAVLRYFDTSARDHHADEEADLFPALILDPARRSSSRAPGSTERRRDPCSPGPEHYLQA